MKKLYVIFLLIAMMLQACGSQKPTTTNLVQTDDFTQTFQKNHLTGTYRYDGKLEGVEIIRTRDQQIEKSGKNGEIRMKIEWISDKSYVLVVESMENVPAGCLKSGSRIKVDITDADDNSFSWSANESNCGGSSGKLIRVR